MAETILPFVDRVKQVCSGTGTGQLSFDSTPSGFQSFSTVYPTATGSAEDRFLYTIATAGSTEWEIGIGYHSTGGLFLNRVTVIRSSNSDALVNFSAGSKDVFTSVHADWINKIPTLGQVLAAVSGAAMP